MAEELVIPKVWRSEIRGVLVFFLLCGVSVYLSRQFPGTVIRGDVITLFGKVLVLDLPIFWLMPFCTFLNLCYRIYNVRYVVNTRFIEARIGILSLKQRLTRVRYEDVRSIESDQTLVERFFNIGNVQIGTAASGEVEVVLEGIDSPREVQEMIQNERDKRQQLEASHSAQGSAVNAV